VVSGGSGVLLQQGEATGEVRGELNRSGQRRCRQLPCGRRWTGCRGCGAMWRYLGGGVGVFTRRRETVKRGLGGDRHFLKGAVVVWSSGGPVVEGATWWD
jgi:hypothetical protein